MPIVRRQLLMFMACGLLPLPTLVRAQGSDERALKMMRGFIDSTPFAQGKFKQTSKDRSGREVQSPSEGHFRFMRPGRFEWVYEKPYAQTITSNGKSLWVFDPDLMQVTVRDITNSMEQTPAGLLFGATNWESTATLTLKDDHTVHADFLQKEGGFEQADIVFGAQGVLERLVLVDNFGQQTEVVFTAFTKSSQTADSFEFKVPKGVDVLKA